VKGPFTLASQRGVLGEALDRREFLKVAGAFKGPETFFDQLYVYAWFVGFGVSGAVYVVLMQAVESRDPEPELE